MDRVIYQDDSNRANRWPPRVAQPRHKRGSRIASASLVLVLALAVLSAQAQPNPAFEAYKQGDYAIALRELQPLAEQGNAAAQTILGSMYANGMGVPQDDSQAAFWYRNAAEQGDAKAQALLGRMYNSGEGVLQDYSQAVFWYRNAAEQGYALGQTLLGSMYISGLGVPEDDVQGYAWLNLAAAQGNDVAKAFRDSIRQGMTREQIAEGQKLSRELAARIAGQGEATP